MTMPRFCCTVTGSREAIDAAATTLAAAATTDTRLDGAGTPGEGRGGYHCLPWHLNAESKSAAEAIIRAILPPNVDWEVKPVYLPRTPSVPPRRAGTSDRKRGPKGS